MIEDFKRWLTEIQETALANKREQALAAGDVTKWQSYIWTSTDKNKDIKARFRDEGGKARLPVAPLIQDWSR